MADFDTVSDAFRAFRDGDITEEKFRQEVDELRAPGEARRRVRDAPLPERRQPDVLGQAKELAELRVERARQLGGDIPTSQAAAQQAELERRRPERALFGRVGRALGFTEPAEVPQRLSELTKRQEATRAVLQKIEKAEEPFRTPFVKEAGQAILGVERQRKLEESVLGALRVADAVKTLGQSEAFRAARKFQEKRVLPAEEEGLALESDAQHVLRLAGGTSALVFEALKSVPTIGPGPGDIIRISREVNEARERGEKPDVFSIIRNEVARARRVRPLGESVFGVTREEEFGEDIGWFRAAMRKIHAGDGIEKTTGQAAVNATGTEDARTFGEVLGLPLEILTPTELAFTKPASIISDIVRVGRRAADLNIEGVSAFDAFFQALRKGDVEMGKTFSEQFISDLAQGQANVDDLPDEIAGLTNEVLQRKYGTSLRPEPEIVEEIVAEGKPRVRAGKTQREVAGEAFEFPENVPSMLEFWRVAEGEKNVRLPKGKGFEVLRHLDPDQDIIKPRYALLNEDSEVVKTGVIGDLVVDMIDRKQVGDSLSYAGQRNVAHWNVAEGKIKSDHHFSSPDERNVVDSFAVSMKPAKLETRLGVEKRFNIAGREAGAGEVLREYFRNATLGRGTKSLGELSESELQLADAVETAYQIWAKEGVGSHRLKVQPWGGLATKAEVKTATRKTKDIFRQEGLDVNKLEPTADGSIILDEKQTDGFNRLAARFGIALGAEDGVASFEDARKLRMAIYKANIATSADEAFAMRGTLPTSEAIMEGLFRFSGARGDQWAKTTKSQSEGLVRKVFGNVDDIARPTWVRDKLNALTRKLSQNGEDLRRELKAMEKSIRGAGRSDIFDAIARADGSAVFAGLDRAVGSFDTTGALQAIAGRYRPVTKAEFDMIDVIENVGALDQQGVFDLRDQVIKNVRAFSPLIQGLKSKNPQAVQSAMQQYAAEKNAAIRTLARKWISSNYPTSSLENIEELAQPEWRAIYEEALDGGDTLLNRFAKQNFPKAKQVETDEALTRFILDTRSDVLLDEVVTELAETDIGLTDQTLVSAISDILKGTAHSGADPDGVTKYMYPEHVLTTARGYIRKWGLDAGSLDEPTAIIGGRVRGLVDDEGKPITGKLFLPRTMINELERAKKLGIGDSRTLFKNRNVLNRALAIQKEALLTGIGIPNVAYFTGNVLGALFQMHLTRGLGETLSTMRTFGRNFPMVAELIKRDGITPITPGKNQASRILETPSGFYTTDELKKLLKQTGADEAVLSFETASTLVSDMARNEPGLFNFVRRNVTGWQEFLRNFAEVPEKAMRISTFLDELVKGVPPEQAGRAAREALYDFSTLTPFEQKNMRKLFLFYTFIRKNQDAHLKALFDHPERIGQQLRFFRDQREIWGQDDFEAMQASPDDLSRFIVGDNTNGKDQVFRPDGSVDPFHKQIFLGSTPLGAAEWVFFNRELGILDADVQQLGRSILGEANPLIKGTIEAAVNVDPGTGWRIDTYGANEVPGWMVQFPYLGEINRSLFDIQPTPLKPTRDPSDADPAATAELVDPTVSGGTYVAGNNKVFGNLTGQDLWRLGPRQFSREVRNIEGLDRALSLWADPRPFATQGEEFFYFASGLRPMVQPTATEVRRLRAIDEQFELKGEAKDIEKLIKGR